MMQKGYQKTKTKIIKEINVFLSKIRQDINSKFQEVPHFLTEAAIATLYCYYYKYILKLLVCSSNYKAWHEIKNHNKVQNKKKTEILLLLNKTIEFN